MVHVQHLVPLIIHNYFFDLGEDLKMKSDNDYIRLRNTLVLYTTAVCNLNCSYCYIDKNPALKEIDSLLDGSFKDENYYYNFTKELFPDSEQLIEVQFWGGEPTLGLNRAFNTVSKLIQHYTKLKTFMFSTNFTNNQWFEQVEGFFELLSKFEDRNFIVNIQLSLDGPQYINDLGRGVGTTEKFLNNFKILLGKLSLENWIPNNVLLKMFFKPTLSLETLKMLQTKESVLKYYEFFDTLNNLILYYSSEKFDYGISIPNTAEPAPTTKADGIRFANFCKLCNELNKEKNDNLLSSFQGSSLIPYTQHTRSNNNCMNYVHGTGTCGIGYTVIGLLPNRKISLCHNGFVDLLQEYKMFCENKIKSENIQEDQLETNFFQLSSTIRGTSCEVSDLPYWVEMSKQFRNDQSTFELSNNVALILLLANSGQIDEKYKNKNVAIKAANRLEGACAFCLRNNLALTGSMILQPVGMMKLLLNGAIDYIYGEN